MDIATLLDLPITPLDDLRQLAGVPRADWERVMTRSGYINLYLPFDHPWVVPAANGGINRMMGEHRYVMAVLVGRKLVRRENVHHKNGIRSDNRPENLELWRLSGQPPGQRVEEQAHCPTCTCGR